MINKLWTGVSLENYNNWYPLTGKIIETPQQYINTWPNVNDWFTTFAIRAQNDINAYLDFILSKFPFDSFKDELIKETLRDMVYVMVEHWVFNRTPIEFNVDSTIQFNNGNQFSASSIPTINVWDLAPSRMKIWARLTELKQVFLNYSEDELDIEKIDLKAFYTRNQVDELIKEQKEFTLSKQIKLYDDVIDDNEHEVFRGAVTKLVNKSYVATEYDPKTETMILDWPDEIGTLPPEALQNNPQIGDFTHAPTADFSAKQQKRINTNENNITKLNDELTKTNESIDDIKNNWFNIETSPLWKQIDNDDFYFDKWTIILWVIDLQDKNDKKIVNTLKKEIKFLLNNNESYNTKSIIQIISWEETTTEVDVTRSVTLFYDYSTKKFLFEVSPTPPTIEFNTNVINQIEVYQYQGNGIPTEFIAEDSTERDYYTKIETNDLLDKKQDKLIAGENIKIDENNKISATGGGVDPNNYYTKPEVDKKLEDTKSQFPIAFQLNAIGQEIPNLETTDKTIVGAINEHEMGFVNLDNKINNKQDKLTLINENLQYGELKYNELPEGQFGDDFGIPPTKVIKKWINESIDKLNIIKWKSVGTKESNIKINYEFKINTLYRIAYSWNATDKGAIKYLIFKYMGDTTILDDYILDVNKTKVISNFIHLIVSETNNISLVQVGNIFGRLVSLEEAENKNTRNYSEQILPIIPPTPCPCPRWKDIAFVEKNGEINYNLKHNTYYRIFYDLYSTRKNGFGNFPAVMKEFYWLDDSVPNYQLFVSNNLSRNKSIFIIQNNITYKITWRYFDNFGNLWKLQELQE